MNNFFAFFGIEEKFEINLSDLEASYFSIQNKFHPDSSTAADIERSIIANEAYKTLSDDFLRACHLMALKGIDILHDENAVKVDFATIEEVIAIQERLASLQLGQNNLARSPSIHCPEITQIKKQLRNNCKSLIEESMTAIKSSNIKLASQKLIKARYFRKILQDLNSSSFNRSSS